ncbi:hypothetical protein KKF81_02265 [Candidatus Micrarchaeota archaeon]|nr:hypothetical protein [Candidatus Micrarchaeota archaeon]MBU1165744.1 hypothetical protein [Candidatus Micrarchaeota archaeon]MBU1887497.1 hypothetical protein [Candidatus Micrarchaeota archaeon]
MGDNALSLPKFNCTRVLHSVFNNHKLLLTLFVFITIISLTSAGFIDFFDSTMDEVENQGVDFVDATGAAGTGVLTTFDSVYDAFSPASCGETWISTREGALTVAGMWLVPAVLVAMIVTFAIASMYMLGQFFNSPSMIAMAKDEGFQSALTVVRVGFIFMAIIGGEAWYGLSTSATHDPIYMANPTMIDASMSFARLMVSDMANHYSVLLLYNMVVHTFYSATMWFGVTWRAMYSFNLGAVLKPLIDIIGTTLQYLSLGMSTWVLHLVTLCLIKKWMWSLFIPLAMLLRALPFTRNAGEAIFALSFALALFYPFMFIFDYEVHKIMQYNIVDAKTAMAQFVNESGAFSVFMPLLIIMFLMAGVFMPFFVGSALTLCFELVRGAIYYIVIMSLLLPFINIFVMLTAAKETAQFFRSDVNFMSFLKIV